MDHIAERGGFDEQDGGHGPLLFQAQTRVYGAPGLVTGREGGHVTC
jgi:hypothetical protein